MSKLNEFVNQLATKAGVEADNPALKSLLSSESLNVEIPDEIVTKYNEHQNGLLTMEAAKNNSELSNHFKANALDGVDQKINEFSQNLKEEQKTALSNEKNTYKRVEMLNGFTNENWTAKLNESGDGKVDVKKYTDEITQLNNTFSTAKSEWDTKWSDREKVHSADKLNSSVNNHFSNYNYADNYEKSDAVMLANNKFWSTVKENNWSVVSENGSIAIKKADNLDAFDNNSVKVTFQSLADQSTASYLKKAPTTPNGNGQVLTTGQEGVNMNSFTAKTNELLGDYKQ